MTTAPSSTSLERPPRHGPAPRAACLRLRWSVAPAALGRPGRAPLALELVLPTNGPARVTLDGAEHAPALQWARRWAGALSVRRVGAGAGRGLLIVDAAPLAIAIVAADRDDRPLHVACDLPALLALRGGRYELAGGGLTK